ncbi:MAG: DUF5522 domain-containing protein [Acidobacteriota bacterium]
MASSAPVSPENAPPKEGEDYYFENGLLVMTAAYLTKRGYCCENGCRHCPYGFHERAKAR